MLVPGGGVGSWEKNEESKIQKSRNGYAIPMTGTRRVGK
jgi:hypothetical protein